VYYYIVNKIAWEVRMKVKGKPIDDKTKKILLLSLKILGLIFCTLLVFLIVLNLVLIIKGAATPETPPAVMGLIPLSVLSDSMDDGQRGTIKPGDLILIKALKVGDSIVVGDIIAFMARDNIVITHRVVEVLEDEQGKYYITKGDANLEVDKDSNGEPAKIREDIVIGKYSSRIANFGFLALSLQTPIGIILFLGIPTLIIVGYDLLRKKATKDKEAKNQKEDTEREGKVVENSTEQGVSSNNNLDTTIEQENKE
jgi:signal peptidase I